MAHYNSYNLLDVLIYMDNRSNSRANTCTVLCTAYWISNQHQLVNYNNLNDRVNRHFHQVSDLSALMVGYWPTMAFTGIGELGFDSGEGA